jgi:hypothetical protein
MGLESTVEFVEHNAGLDRAAARLRIERQNSVEALGTIDDQRLVHRLPALRGPPAAGQDRRLLGSSDGQGSGRFLHRAGNDDAQGHNLIGGRVGRITTAREGVELDFADARIAQPALEPRVRTTHSLVPLLDFIVHQLSSRSTGDV